jgi:hypothetical protein
VLIDNFIDEQTFTQLSKKQPDVFHPPLSSLEGGSDLPFSLPLMQGLRDKILHWVRV